MASLRLGWARTCPAGAQGDEEAVEFVADLLTQFSGAAMDDYTDHLWSLAELRAGHRVAGHSFFDYKGWYAEREPNA